MQFFKSILGVAAVSQVAAAFYYDEDSYGLFARDFDDEYDGFNHGLTARDHIEIDLFARHLDDIYNEFVLQRRGGPAKMGNSEARESYKASGLSGGSTKEYRKQVNDYMGAAGGDASKSRQQLSDAADRHHSSGGGRAATQDMAAAAAAHGRTAGYPSAGRDRR